MTEFSTGLILLVI